MRLRRRKRYRGVGLSVSKGIILLFALLVFGSPFFVLETLGLDQKDAGLSAIGRAELAMGLAYEMVLEAEGAGADVSGLLNELNDGAEILSKAYMSYRVGDYDDAVYFANVCCDLVEGISVKANELQHVAIIEMKERFALTSVGSVVAIGCVYFGGVLGWRFFKRRYHRRVLKMKPEVAKYES